MKLKPEWLVWGSLALGAVVHIHLASSDDGIYWPDEIYQSLEPAHRLVHGYGFVAWEFIEGARNWALPGLVAGLLALAKGLGLDDPKQYLLLVRFAFIAAALGSAWGVWRLAKALGAGEWPAALASAAASLYALGLYFGHRAMSENASALPVVLGLWLLVEGEGVGHSTGAQEEAVQRGSGLQAPGSGKSSGIRRLMGASLLGLAVLLRLQCGLFCVIVLGWQLARKKWREAGETLGVFAGWAFLFGLLDHLTWADAPGAHLGGWFHSAIKYLQFNLVEGKGAAWGTAGFGYYLHTLWTAMPPLWLVLGLGALLAARKAPFVFVCAALFFVAHSYIPHKELRFLLPMLPLVFALAAVGLSQLPQGRPAQLGLAALALAAGFSFARHATLTFGDLGAYPERPTASAWDDFGPINRLLARAGRQSDLCGIRVPAHLAWVGGYTYLHKNVPLYMPNQPPELRHFNYAVVPRGSVPAPAAQDGSWELVKLFDGCAPDPGFSWRLP